ncbi:hypothetical protein SAMD00019534_124070 [Acytostelium subglobosum LB1]|uniref:hypothetical protein n=1 Tax=Acytostelium subglobosum LB1 TaxID=1410327 RepID=UPI0006450ABA|nr:hypothetical protein SAMD00019534_124070 [Acytostelium subglobosum LB1]GAM29231.1 hypothetical protein SAMD00019534_124070 [Acytostelium subglobosum LB1]|eukprot:XP_012747805.1 hypothetical protein SAMD00019534_124070 [Acytostelium subglobosum LB1]
MENPTSSTLREKTEELVRRSISKVVQSVLSARVDILPQQKKINKHFHIETEDSDSVQKVIESIIFARHGIRTLFLLDIHFDEGGEMLGLNTLVESWRFIFEPYKDVDTTCELPKLYRNVILLVRALYSLLRNLPCYQVYRNFTKNRSSTSKIKYQIRICDVNSIHSPSFALSTQTKSFVFTHIPTPLGVWRMDVAYKEDLTREISISSQLGLDSQFIIKDYNNNNYYRHESATTPQQSTPLKSTPPSGHYSSSYGSSTPIPMPATASLPIKQTSQQQQYQPQPAPYYSSSSGKGDTFRPSSFGSNDSYDYYTHSGGSGIGSYSSGGGMMYQQQQQQQQQILQQQQQQLLQQQQQQQQDVKSSNPIIIPNSANNVHSYKKQSPSSLASPINATPGTSHSPPFYQQQLQQHQLQQQQQQQQQLQQQQQQQQPLVIRQLNFTPQPSPAAQHQVSPTSALRHRSTSAPIAIAPQPQMYQQAPQPIFAKQPSINDLQQYQATPHSFTTGVSPPFNNSRETHLSQQKPPSGNNSNISTSSGINNTHSSSSFKSSINSKLSQIHGPLLLSDPHKEHGLGHGLGLGGLGLGLGLGLDSQIPSTIEHDEPAFASAISSVSKTSDSEVGEFVRLCKIAPPLKLFNAAFSSEAPLSIDQDVLDLSRLSLQTASGNNNNNANK